MIRANRLTFSLASNKNHCCSIIILSRNICGPHWSRVNDSMFCSKSALHQGRMLFFMVLRCLLWVDLGH